MKITHLKGNNFIGFRSGEINLSTPALLLAGHGGAGKTSLVEGVRAAFRGEITRIKHKKDYSLLVTDGAKIGQFLIGTTIGDSTYTLPDGSVASKLAWLDAKTEALPYVLQPALFATLDDDARRKLLFSLSGVSLSGAEVKKRLLARKIDAALVDAIGPHMAKGFEAAEAFAKSKATEAKGAWRATTQQTYGSKVAEGWSIPVPAFNQEVYDLNAEALRDARRDLSVAQSDLGAIRSTNQSAAARAERMEQLRATIATKDEVEAKLQPLLDAQEATRKAAVAAGVTLNGIPPAPVQPVAAEDKGPPVAGFSQKFPLWFTGCLTPGTAQLRGQHDDWDIVVQADTLRLALRGAFSKLADACDYAPGVAPEPVEDPHAQRRQQAKDAYEVAKRAEEDADRAVSRTDLQALLRGIAEAEVILKALESETGAVDAQAQADMEQKVAYLQQSINDLAEAIDKDRSAANAVALAQKTNENATKYHAEVVAWSNLADALSPSGIPGEIVNEALLPFNNLLGELARSAEWESVVIGHDMSLRCGNRLYGLRSKSQRMQADLMLAIAIAYVSGIKFVLADDFDTFLPEHRIKALQLVDECITLGTLDGALLVGAFAKRPEIPWDTFTVAWMADGKLEA